MRRFDRKRPGRKTSNEQWVNPHDVEARMGKKKDGATDMIYKPEHVVDLETGAIIAAEILPGDQGETEQLNQRIVEAGETLHQVMPEEPVEKLGAKCHSGQRLLRFGRDQSAARAWGLRPSSAIREKRRRHKGLDKEDRLALRRAAAVRESKYGKTLLRRRGQYLERSFEHILDEGGLRQASLRGRENLTKRYKLGAAFYNLSQLLRKLYGIGTARQWVAAGPELCSALFAFFRQLLTCAVRFFYSCRAKFFPRCIFQLNPFAA